MSCPTWAIGCGNWSTITNSCREANCGCCQELDPCINVKTGLPGSDGLTGDPGESVTLRDAPLTVTIAPLSILNIDTTAGLTVTDNGSGEATIGFTPPTPSVSFVGARQGLTENAGYVELGAASWQTTGGSIFGTNRFVNANRKNFAITSDLVSMGGTINAVFGGGGHTVTVNAEQSAIIAGSNSTMDAFRSVVLGGNGINATQNDYAYVPNLNINYQPVTNYTIDQVLVRDPATGNVYVRDDLMGSGGDDFVNSGTGNYDINTNTVNITLTRVNGGIVPFSFPLTGIAGANPPPYLWKIATSDTGGSSVVNSSDTVTLKKGTGITSITRLANDVTINTIVYDAAEGVSKNGNNFELGTPTFSNSGYGFLGSNRFIQANANGFVLSTNFVGAIGSGAVVMGGSAIKNTGTYAFIGGGINNRIDSAYSAIGAGENNAINPTFTHGFVAAGKGNTITAVSCFSTGNLNQNNGDFSSTFGMGAITYYAGESALGGSIDLTVSRHQGSHIVLNSRSSRGSAFFAFQEVDASGDGLLLSNKSDYSFKGNAIGRSDAGTSGATFDVVVHAKVVGGVMSIVSSSAILVSSYGNGSGWNLIISTSGNKLQISANTTLDDAYWTLDLRWAEIAIL